MIRIAPRQCTNPATGTDQVTAPGRKTVAPTDKQHDLWDHTKHWGTVNRLEERMNRCMLVSVPILLEEASSMRYSTK